LLGAESAIFWNNEILHEGRINFPLKGRPEATGHGMKIEEARIEDAKEIMGWFPDKESVTRWGSPYMSYPLKDDTFFGDIYWDRMSSRVARTEDGSLLAFGQFYTKLGRCHLARLVINPEYRGRGFGEKFVSALMDHGAEQLGTDEFSLYVMTANRPAYNCYKNLGFELARQPEDDARLEDVVFMVARRPGL
jgi:ribosomal protein S18 acetylase RimI-like enzyme